MGTEASKLGGIWSLLNKEGAVCDKTGEVGGNITHVDHSKEFRFYSQSSGNALKSFKLENPTHLLRRTL